MKFKCGRTWEDKMAYLKSWHPWFAWRPVKVASYDCRWLETVWRRNLRPEFPMSFIFWEYSATNPDADPTLAQERAA